MNKQRKSSVFLALLVFIIAIGSFLYLYLQSRVKNSSYSLVESNSTAILDNELTRIKEEATTLLYNRKNLTSMPIPEPKPKMGKKGNPFSQ